MHDQLHINDWGNTYFPESYRERAWRWPRGHQAGGGGGDPTDAVRGCGSGSDPAGAGRGSGGGTDPAVAGRVCSGGSEPAGAGLGCGGGTDPAVATVADACKAE